jgi:hypothetical protein
LTTILYDREHREQNNINITNLINLLFNSINFLLNWLFGISNGIKERIQEDKNLIRIEFLRGRPRPYFGDIVRISTIILQKL